MEIEVPEDDWQRYERRLAKEGIQEDPLSLIEQDVAYSYREYLRSIYQLSGESQSVCPELDVEWIVRDCSAPANLRDIESMPRNELKGTANEDVDVGESPRE